MHQFSYGLHKEQLKVSARGNSSVTLPSWNEFVVATETPWCMLQPVTTTSSVIGVVAATVEGQHILLSASLHTAGFCRGATSL